MHNGEWNDGWSGASLWWMAIMMIALLGAIAWVTVTLVRHNNSAQAQSPSVPGQVAAGRPTAQEILAERLARGEIEPDEYSKRLAALLDAP
jgi:putative membrane protein